MAAINLLQSTAKAIANLFSNELEAAVPGISNGAYLDRAAHVTPKASSVYGRLAA